MHLANPNLPFGVGASGIGKYHGKYSLILLVMINHIFLNLQGWNQAYCSLLTKENLNILKHSSTNNILIYKSEN